LSLQRAQDPIGKTHVVKKRGSRKRCLQDSNLDLADELPPKRPRIESFHSAPQPDFSLAKLLVSTFDKLERDLQMRILKVVDDQLRADPKLLASMLTLQVSNMSFQANSHYQKHERQALDNLLAQAAPEAAILLNLDISLTN